MDPLAFIGGGGAFFMKVAFAEIVKKSVRQGV